MFASGESKSIFYVSVHYFVTLYTQSLEFTSEKVIYVVSEKGVE